MSEFMNNFQFLRPYWLFAIIPLLLAIVYWNRFITVQTDWHDYVDAKFLEPLGLGKAEKKSSSRLPRLYSFVAGILCIFALAGPVWQKLPQPIFKIEQARVFVLDLSESMLAADVAPNRLARAKLKLLDLLNLSKEGQSALVVFAQSPYVVSPLTDDAQTIAAMVPPLSTDIVPVQGDDVDAAIEQARDLLVQANLSRGEIILIGDSVVKDDTNLRRLQDDGFKLNVLAVGTEKGAPIEATNGGFLKNSQGAILMPRLDTQSMKSMADLSGGRYSEISIDDSDLKILMTEPGATDMRFSESQDERVSDQWREEGPWLLALVVIIVALSMRRAWLFSIVLVATIAPYDPLYAADFDMLWKNDDQRGKQLFDEKKYRDAAQTFGDTRWQATSLYRDNKFAEALERFSKEGDVEDIYNRANTLAKLQKIEEAIKTYDEVLKRSPQHEDAQHNRDLLQSFLDQQENKQQNGQGDEQQNNEQQNQDEKQGADGQQGNENDQQENNADQSSDKSKGQQSQQQQQAREKGKEPSDNESQQTAQSGQDKKEEAEQETQSQVAKQDDENKQEMAEEKQAVAATDSKEAYTEESQAMEQWLRRIPDDPGGLLRQKFIIQHRMRDAQRRSE
ncbi:MAG: VWA domain-containing protein [Gammaproteobacteria bacterium]|nr:VWA domain-containing protein [Gammaproteobacteria bacterium]